MSFENLKRSKGSTISKLVSAASGESTPEKKSYVDERIWKPTVMDMQYCDFYLRLKAMIYHG